MSSTYRSTETGSEKREAIEGLLESLAEDPQALSQRLNLTILSPVAASRILGYRLEAVMSGLVA